MQTTRLKLRADLENATSHIAHDVWGAYVGFHADSEMAARSLPRGIDSERRSLVSLEPAHREGEQKLFKKTKKFFRKLRHRVFPHRSRLVLVECTGRYSMHTGTWEESRAADGTQAAHPFASSAASSALEGPIEAPVRKRP